MRQKLVEAWIASAWTREVDGDHRLGVLPLGDRATSLRLLERFPTMINSLRDLQPECQYRKDDRHYAALAWLPNRWHMNYFHWTLDLLPSLIEAYRFCSVANAKLSVITPSKTELQGIPYINDWLSLLDQRFGEATKTAIEQHRFEETPTLHLVTGRIRKVRSGRIAVGITPQIIRSLRRFQSCGTRTPPLAGKKILILRGAGAFRRNKSDIHIENVFAERGFEPIDFSELPVRSQLTVLDSCDEVAGIHGAALTNLIWSNKCAVTEVIDLRHSWLHRRSEFYEISCITGSTHVFRFRNDV
jgi:hypothetical protein